MIRRAQPLYRCGLEEHWHRQIGAVRPTSFARRIGGCEDLIKRLVKFAELEGHTGCVNTVSFNPTGELLVSGSDDQDIIVWNWAGKKKVLSYDSGHENNVFQARVMPFSDDRVIVSCAADGQVRYGTLLGDGKVTTKSLARHRGRAHKMAIEPGSPRVFYSCGEDGVVQHFDLREEKSTKLLTCHHFSTGGDKAGKPRVLRLNAIVMNPRNCNYIAVGGSDQYARVYDIRRVAGMDDQPVDCYAPKHLQGPGHEEHITCVAYSKQEEILVSYNDELIYLFDQSMSLGTSPQSNAEDGVKREDDGPHPESNKPQVYQGHRNLQTVKGVNFFGPNTEYIVSGSDCGRVFIWKKRGGKLVALFKGDKSVVNCLEPHPYATILATSGIDDTIKVWAPLSDTTLELPEDAEKVMENNKRRRENHATSIPLTPELLRNLLLLRHLQAPTDGEGRRSTRVSFEGWSPDAEDEETSDDGDTVNPRECTIS